MADPQPGVTKIVKLGAETLLIMRIENGKDVPEGELTITKIEAVPAEDEASLLGVQQQNTPVRHKICTRVVGPLV